MDKLMELNGIINSFVWGPYMLILLVGTGVYLTFRTNFMSIAKLGYILKSTLLKMFKKVEKAKVKLLHSRQLQQHLQQQSVPVILPESQQP